MKIVKVHSPKLIREYINLPWKIYKDSPPWTPPLKSEMRATMDKRKNPFHSHAEVEHFIAQSSGGETVGRVAACIYPVEHGEPKTDTAYFGFFESINDLETARSLLTTVEDWARKRGMKRLSGPYNYCSTQEMGLLVEGFEEPAAIFQTYNPPYYLELLTQCGYMQEFGMTTYRLEASKWYQKSEKQIEHLVAQGNGVKVAGGLTVRTLNMRQYKQEMRLLLRVFNESFAHNAGVLPVSEDVFDYQVKALKPFIDPSIILFIEQNNRIVGFAFLLPNLNPLLKKFNGSVGLLDFLRLKKDLTRLNSAIILLIGAIPDEHGRGIGRVVVSEFLQTLKGSKYKELHTTWVHESNWTPKALLRRLGFEKNKTYLILGRELSRH